jgi:hypothetical protein
MVNIIRVARDIVSDDRVYLVMGGFHLAGASSAQVESTVQEFRRLSVENMLLATAIEMRRVGCSRNHMGKLTWKAGSARGYHFHSVRGVPSRNS